MAAPKRFFKIRHKKSGYYSKGGTDAGLSSNGDSYDCWSKSGGKIWNGTGPLRNHLRSVIDRGAANLDDWEVIELELTEINKLPATEMISNEQLISMLKRNHQYERLYK